MVDIAFNQHLAYSAFSVLMCCVCVLAAKRSNKTAPGEMEGCTWQVDIAGQRNQEHHSTCATSVTLLLHC